MITHAYFSFLPTLHIYFEVRKLIINNGRTRMYLYRTIVHTTSTWYSVGSPWDALFSEAGSVTQGEIR